MPTFTRTLIVRENPMKTCNVLCLTLSTYIPSPFLHAPHGLCHLAKTGTAAPGADFVLLIQDSEFAFKAAFIFRASIVM